ncbi:MAG: TIGR02147 family protein [Proteobacteria bacterium]|nr:MAG: TIGR02147 family protein [Pseudomonadota bacterium]
MSQELVHIDIRTYLQAELVRRCKANPRYSLRAMADFLNLESSALSKILNGKRAVTATMFEKLATKLALAPDEIEAFGSQIEEPRGRSRLRPPKKAAFNYQKIADDHYLIFSDWYHFAILELLAVEGFEPKPNWIARTLGLSLAETKAAIERLTRNGFIEVHQSGRWVDATGSVTNIESRTPSSAARKLQLQLFTKALHAIEHIPIEERDHTGMTMAVDSKLLPEAKRRVAKFRRELCDFLESSSRKDSVYQMSIALFPLSKRSKTTSRRKS